MFEEAFPEENLFVVANRASSSHFKYVKADYHVLSRVDFMQRKDEFEFTHVYIHLLNARKINILKKVNTSHAAVYWIIWGLDLYNKLLQVRGFEMIDKQSSYYRNHLTFSRLFPLFSQWKQKLYAASALRFISQRIDYIVTDTVEQDYDYLVRYYPSLQNKPWKDFFYYPLDVILGPKLLTAQVTGHDIIIGNSASLTNNHEYVMRILSRFSIGERRVVVPLSYSGKRGYVESVVKAGNSYFKENFVPLLKFMPLDEYNRLQMSIGIALYGNWRQEAIGNILVALYLGSKVFLSRVNPVYEWALSRRLVVFALEDISQEAIDTPLPHADMLWNREILISLYNKERMLKLMREMHNDSKANISL